MFFLLPAVPSIASALAEALLLTIAARAANDLYDKVFHEKDHDTSE